MFRREAVSLEAEEYITREPIPRMCVCVYVSLSPTRGYLFDICDRCHFDLGRRHRSASFFNDSFRLNAIIYRLSVSGSLDGSNLFQLICVNIGRWSMSLRDSDSLHRHFYLSGQRMPG